MDTSPQEEEVLEKEKKLLFSPYNESVQGNDAVFRTEGALMHELTRAPFASDLFKLEYFPRDVSFFANDNLEMEQVIDRCNAMPNVLDCKLLDEFVNKEGRKSKVLKKPKAFFVLIILLFRRFECVFEDFFLSLR